MPAFAGMTEIDAGMTSGKSGHDKWRDATDAKDAMNAGRVSQAGS